MTAAPYHVGVSNRGTDFEVHRHPELEFNYCRSGGGYTVIIDGEPYEMTAGKLAITSSMVSHEYIKDEENVPDTSTVTVTVGSVFLGEYYGHFSNAVFECPIFDLNGNGFKHVKNTLDRIAENKSNNPNVSKLVERGLIYELCAYILRDVIEPFSDSSDSRSLVNIKKIEMALEYINSHYSREITVSEIAALCGYSESNFCRHFKNITGTSFHSSLNKKRVENSCALLKSTSLSLEDIAIEVGFADAKSLCRVFKNEMGTTPNKYRKEKN